MEGLESCAICNTTEDDSFNLNNKKLLLNKKCGHKFCQTCIRRELARSKSFPCQKCQQPVKKATLTDKSLNEIECERDVSWRKKVLAVYNKTEDDFDSLDEYNDYLEEVETKIYNLCNGIDVESITKELNEYQQAHKDEILLNRANKAEEERRAAQLVAAAAGAAEAARRQAGAEDARRARDRNHLRQEILEVALEERDAVTVTLDADPSAAPAAAQAGGGDAGAAGGGGGGAAGGPWPALLQFQTPQPQPVGKPGPRPDPAGAGAGGRGEGRRERARRCQAAGGYDPKVGNKRNWSEAGSALGLYFPELSPYVTGAPL